MIARWRPGSFGCSRRTEGVSSGSPRTSASSIGIVTSRPLRRALAKTPLPASTYSMTGARTSLIVRIGADPEFEAFDCQAFGSNDGGATCEVRTSAPAMIHVRVTGPETAGLA